MKRLILLVLGAASFSARAQDFDAARDFSLTNNPNMAWSYGWRAPGPGAFSLATLVTPTMDPALFVWQGKPENSFFYGVPHVMFNASSQQTANASTTYRPRKITMVPGPVGELAIIRWTAPSAGNIRVEAEFTGRDPATTTTAFVLLGNETRFLQAVNRFGPSGAAVFTTNVVVTAGDTIDFGINYGAGGNWMFDTTEVEARITYMSQPGTPLLYFPPAGRFTNAVAVGLTATIPGAEIRYTLDGTPPTPASARYEGPLVLTGRVLVTARAFVQGFAVGDPVSALYERVYAHAGDGIPDAWRQHHFGPDFATNPQAAPDADPDGDGLDNFREFLAGTDPLDPASGVVLGIRAVPELRWRGVSNLLYRVLRRDLTGPGAWQVIGTVQGTNGTATFLDLEARLPESYYALEVVR